MGDIKSYEPFFSDWYIDGRIGSGAFSKVYKIRKKGKFGEGVDKYFYSVLKHIPVPGDSNTVDDSSLNMESKKSLINSIADNIYNEIKIMDKLKGKPNIVYIEDHDAIVNPDGVSWDIFIKMELLTPIAKVFNIGKISTDEIIVMGMHICRALEDCQEENIIHRDIKPGNIFVSPNAFKLGDFGVAKEAEKAKIFMTRSGTPIYMAPEVIKNKPYDASVDMYSLGMVMYQYLNNHRLPFYPTEGSYSMDTIDEAMERRKSGLEAILPPINAPEELARIILKACAYKPGDRYKSPSEMYNALDALKNKRRINEKSILAEVAGRVEEPVAEEYVEKTVAARYVDVGDEKTQRDERVFDPVDPKVDESEKKPFNKKVLIAAAVAGVSILALFFFILLPNSGTKIPAGLTDVDDSPAQHTTFDDEAFMKAKVDFERVSADRIIEDARVRFIDSSVVPLDKRYFLDSLSQVETLVIKGEKLEDLNFLEDLKSLKHLDLSLCTFSDNYKMPELSGLVSLNIKNSGIKDLGFLAKYQNLEVLNISGNSFENIRAIEDKTSLTKLVELYAYDVVLKSGDVGKLKKDELTVYYQ